MSMLMKNISWDVVWWKGLKWIEEFNFADLKSRENYVVLIEEEDYAIF